MQNMPLAGFADKINEVMPVIAREFARRQAKELLKVTLSQFLTLELLHRQGESKMTDLANFMKITTAAMTGIVERLVRDGFVFRGNDPKDRRIIKIKLTDKGEKLVKKVSEARRQMVIGAFGKISEKDRSDYLRIITQVKDILIKENGAQVK